MGPGLVSNRQQGFGSMSRALDIADIVVREKDRLRPKASRNHRNRRRQKAPEGLAA